MSTQALYAAAWVFDVIAAITQGMVIGALWAVFIIVALALFAATQAENQQTRIHMAPTRRDGAFHVLGEEEGA